MTKIYRCAGFYYRGVHIVKAKNGWRQHASGKRLFLQSKRWLFLNDAIRDIDAELKR